MKKLYSFILLSIISFSSIAQIVEITANPGSSGNIVIGQSNYHISESIYLDSEIGASNFLTSGTSITKIAFSVNANTSVVFPVTINNVKISLKNTTATTLTTGTNNTSGYTIVFSGAITFSGLGWKTIPLSTSFVRTPGQNLQLKIERSDNLSNSGILFDAAMGNNTSPTAISSRRYNGTASITTTTALTPTFFRPAIQFIRPFPIDAQAIGIINPVNSCFSSNQTIKVAVKNNGTTVIAAGAASVNLSITGANTSITTSSNISIIPVDSTALVIFNGINLNTAGSNQETAIVNIASDGYRSNDTATSNVTTATILSTLPQTEDVEGQFNVFAYLKAVIGTNAWTVLSLISNTGAFNNGWNLDSLTTRPNGTGADFFLFDSYDAAPGTVSRLFSNCIALPSTGASRVSFWMSHDSAFATNLDSLYLSVSNNKGVSWTRIKGFRRPDASLIEYAWIQDSVDISAYNGQTVQLAFEGVSAFGNAFGLDDINVYNVNICLPIHNITTITSCNSYTWVANNNTVYTNSGTYIRTYINACGVASADTLKLTINQGSYSSVSRSACVSYSWPTNGQTYSNSGTYIRNYTNASGCPSADTLKLTINQGTFTSSTVSSCGSYTWSNNGQTYSTSGTYIRNYTNGSGCLSADTLKLTVNRGTFISNTITACGSYTWTANGQTYNSSGVYIRTYNNVNGCASADTLKLTINQGTYTSTSITNCGNYTWSANGQVYSNSGTYTRNYTNGTGCSSTDTLKLTIKQGTFTTSTIISCGSYTWPANSQTYNASGSYIRNYTNGNGCLSADTLRLTINQGTFTSIIVNNCSSYTWQANGVTYSLSGTYVRNYTNGQGCSSTDTLKLTINQGTFTTISITNCESYTWSVNNQTYTTSGVYIRTYNNASGCLSADTLKLTINRGNFISTTISSCGNYVWNGTTYTSSGSYTKVYINSNGCPSADTLKLTINRGTFTSTSVTNCGNYVWNGNTYTASGTYTKSYLNGFGCASVDTLKLIINQGTFTSQSVTNCGSYVWNGNTYSSTGTYIKSYLNVSGCNSADTLKLTINQGTFTSLSVTNCSSYVWNGNTYTSSGTYTRSYINSSGCTSVDTLKLTINQGTFTSLSITNCGSYVWNGNTYTSSGTYTKTYTNGSGCASVDTLKLTINQGTYSSTSITNCGSYVWNGNTYTTSGTYIRNFINSSGCLSVDTLRLTINSGNNNSISVIKCGNYTWPKNGQNYTSSGTYTYNYINSNGCNSTDTLYLSLTPAINNTNIANSCGPYIWTTSGNTYTTSGTYYYNNLNCGTTDTLRLTVNQGTFTSTSVIQCGNYSWNGNTYTTSGIYSKIYTNASGCISVDTLKLTINQGTFTTTSASTCGSYVWNGNIYSTSGTYTRNYNNGSGCASVDTLNLTINQGSFTSISVNSCGSYVWNGNTYTASGTYTRNYTNSTGCGSVDTLNLIINEGTYTATNITSCNSYDWNGNTYTTSGTYTRSYSNSTGCGSVDTLNLIINQGTFTSTTASSCGSYLWNGNNYTISGTYTRNYTNGLGCASVDTLKLTINQGTFISTSVNNCDNYTWYGTTYSASGTYTRVYTNGFGCTSVDTLKLTINRGTFTSINITECESYAWNGNTYTTSGIYTKTYNNLAGCLSVDTLILNLNQGTHTSTNVVNCGSYLWNANGQTYSVSGIYTRVYTNVLGCTSTDTLKLIINQGTYTSTSITNCGSYTWPADGQTYNASGNYIHTYFNSSGCPSADTLKLTINQGTYTSTSITNCGSYSWLATGQVYSTSGTYTNTYNNNSGCSSTDTLKLTINQGTYTSTSITSCGSYTWAANGQTYNASGNYIRSYTNGIGCPSADTLKLTISQATNTSASVTTCGSYTWPLNGQTYIISGTYIRNYINGQGCSSADTLKLIITQGTFTLNTITACDSYTWNVNGQTYLSSGIYLHSYNNSFGCPSVDTLKLTINQSTFTSTSVTTCENYIWPVDGQIYNVTGTYIRNYTNSSGCASADTLHLWINHATNNSITQTSCDEYTWSSNGQTYTTSGTYTRNYVNGLGCASTDTLYLTINNHTDSTVTITTNGDYIWPLNGELYTESGIYYHTISESNRCVIVKLNLIISTVKIYPNPTSGIIKLNLSNLEIPDGVVITISVFDRTGKLIKKQTTLSNTLNEINLTPYSNGLYILRVQTPEKIYFSSKIIKQSFN